MSQPSRVEAVVHAGGPERFRFLVESGYDGPEVVADGLVYHGDLVVTVSGTSGREPEVVTLVALRGGERWTRLSTLYVHTGLGPAQDVPESARSTRVARMRLDAQAGALRLLLNSSPTDDIERAVVACHAG